MKNADLKKEWDVRIAEFKTSGQSIPQWCANQNLKTHQLRYWLQKTETREASLTTSTEWFSLDIDKQTDESSSSVTVKIGQVHIEVKPGFKPDLLTDVVRTLMTLC